MRAAFLLILFVFTAQAAQVRVSFMNLPEKSVSCGHALAALVQGISPGDDLSATFGTFKDLGNLLSNTGMPRHEIGIFTILFDDLVKNGPTDNSILAKTLARLREASSDSEALLVCALGPGCKFKLDANAMYISGEKDFAAVAFNGSETEGGVGHLNVDSKHEAQLPKHSIILPGHVKNEEDSSAVYSAQGKLTDIIHEGTHFADEQIVDVWLKANKQLGEGADYLFKKYTRIGKDSKLEVDRGFLDFFFESRAEIASFELLKFQMRDSKSTKLNEKREEAEKFYRNRAIAGAGYLSNASSDIMRDLGVTEKNVFELGYSLESLMLSTISRAGLRVP